jgi:hypothetical protein
MEVGWLLHTKEQPMAREINPRQELADHPQALPLTDDEGNLTVEGVKLLIRFTADTPQGQALREQVNRQTLFGRKT